MGVLNVYMITELNTNRKSKPNFKKMKQILKGSLIATCILFAIINSRAQSWVPVGTTGFSDSSATGVSIAVDKNGIPYVVFSDAANGGKATVMKFDGTSWTAVGPKGFSAGWVGSTSIAIDTNGTPYVGYADGGSSGRATVMKYNGTNWVNVGSPGVFGQHRRWHFNGTGPGRYTLCCFHGGWLGRSGHCDEV